MRLAVISTNSLAQNPYAPVLQVYDEMRALCLQKLPTDVCDGLLPNRPLYYPPENRPTVPVWVWLLAGAVIGRFIYAKS